MPEMDNQRPRRTIEEDGFLPNPRADFVELGITTCFSFLRGASDAVDLATTAHALGYDKLGCADLNTMAGVVRLHAEARKAQITPIIGCRLQLVSGEEFLAYPRDRAAYGRLCMLLSKGKMHDVEGVWQAKGVCDITLDDLAKYSAGVQLIALPGADLDHFSAGFRRLKHALPTLKHVAASYLYRGDDRARINQLDALARANGMSILATNDVHYHAPARRPLQDVMTCILHKTTIQKAGFLLDANAERHLKSPAQMARLFGEWPHAIKATRDVADACTFKLTELAYEYPQETVPANCTPQEYLEELTWKGAVWRYPKAVPDSLKATLRRELALIAKLDIAQYFLTIQQVVNFARYECDPPILCQGRGSAANSAVCYVLGITAVDPATNDLLFERFISEERKEPPDIDVDFEHERREEVIQYIYKKYGRDHAALAATVITYRPRSAIRDVGKALGLDQALVDKLAKSLAWWDRSNELADRFKKAGIDDGKMAAVFMSMLEQILGFPRHLSQHVGGFLITEQPIHNLVPVENAAMQDRTIIQWDKEDIEALGLLKVDVLALGMLTAIRKSFELIDQHWGKPTGLKDIPNDDVATYDMLCAGDSLGVFQVESRAQMSMLPRLKPRRYYDLVVQVAIVRPGPIQGDMVHPYLKRRQGLEQVDYPSAEVQSVLDRTLGVPIFQEQVIKLAMVAAGFSGGEADQLRRAMASWGRNGSLMHFEQKLMQGMGERGYSHDFAERLFKQMQGFGEYGFPESHAASFAHLVYVSSWLKCHYPAAFYCALLNSQPMGFYSPSQIVQDASRHGVTVLPIDIDHSDWDHTLTDQDPLQLRLGMRLVKGFNKKTALRVVSRRTQGYSNLQDLAAKAGLNKGELSALVDANAVNRMTGNRYQGHWQQQAIDASKPLLEANEQDAEYLDDAKVLDAPLEFDDTLADYQSTGLTLARHPMLQLRHLPQFARCTRCIDLPSVGNKRFATVAGVVTGKQRPGTAAGVIFMTLEDETGNINVVIWKQTQETFRRELMSGKLLKILGTVEHKDNVTHMIAGRLEDHSDLLQQAQFKSRDFH